MAKKKLKTITKKKARSSRYKSRYQVGGMYGDNTVASAGQGVGQTANIVYDESNPEIQKQREQQLIDTQKNILESSEEMSTFSTISPSVLINLAIIVFFLLSNLQCHLFPIHTPSR